MSLQVDGIVYATPRDCLQAVQRMVRTGVTRGGSVKEVQQNISRTIQALKESIGSGQDTFTESEKLRLLTLEAENYQQCGQFHKAASTLKPTWDRLRYCFDDKKKPLGPSADRELLRQRIWALLSYIWYAHYRVAGDPGTALKYFLRVESVIRAELQTADYTPHGTLALCHYFSGVCSMPEPGAMEAERHLLEAQKEALNRVVRQLKKSRITHAERAYEIAYKDLFSARVLSGLSRVALQQGHLLRAENFIRAAQGLLVDRQNHSLTLFSGQILWTVLRRRSAFDDPLHQESLHGLESCTESFKKLSDPTGQSRCTSELACAYMDMAEFGKLEIPANAQLAKAEYWLGKGPDSGVIPKPEALRHILLAARLERLRDHIPEAVDGLFEARDFFRNAGLAKEYLIEITIAEVWVYLAQQNIAQARLKASQALDAISQRVSSPSWAGGRGRERHAGVSVMRRLPNPVAEAECHLLLAKAELAEKNREAARMHLKEWATFSNFIDNYYLDRLGELLTAELNAYDRAPVFMREFDGYNPVTRRISTKIPDYLKEYENWLRMVLKKEFGMKTKVQLGPFYGKDPSNIDRNQTSKKRKPRENDGR